MQLIECSGHPRDLGFDQGRSLRGWVRDRVKELGLPLRRTRWPSLQPFVGGSVRGREPAREMIRHYTHLAERVDGLARGADVPVDSLYPLQGEYDREHGAPVISLSAVGLDGVAGGTLVRGLHGSGWVVRRSRPQVGFESVELTQPWLVSAVAGINEASLAVCLVPRASAPEPEDLSGSQPPARLLVQECLQRFGDVEAGLDWCAQRPAADSVDLWLSDATGRRAVVRFEGEKRSLISDQGGARVSGGSVPQVDALRDTADSESRLDLKLLEQVLEGQGASAFVRLVCSHRRLEVKVIEGVREETIRLELEPFAGDAR